jgi:hypothetical protein
VNQSSCHRMPIGRPCCGSRLQDLNVPSGFIRMMLLRLSKITSPAIFIGDGYRNSPHGDPIGIYRRPSGRRRHATDGASDGKILVENDGRGGLLSCASYCRNAMRVGRPRRATRRNAMPLGMFRPGNHDHFIRLVVFVDRRWRRRCRRRSRTHEERPVWLSTIDRAFSSLLQLMLNPAVI